jgi:hypothetical protein
MRDLSSYLARIISRGPGPWLVPPRRAGRLWAEPLRAAEPQLAFGPPAEERPFAGVDSDHPSSAAQIEVPRLDPQLSPASDAPPEQPSADATPPRQTPIAVLVPAAAEPPVVAPAKGGERQLAPPQPAAGSPRECSVPGASPMPGAQRATEPQATPAALRATVSPVQRPAVSLAAAAPEAPRPAGPVNVLDERRRRAAATPAAALVAAFAWTSSPELPARAPFADPPPRTSASAPGEPPLLQIGAIDIEVLPPATAAAPRAIPREPLARGYLRSPARWS